jgi:hypothetical protein
MSPVSDKWLVHIIKNNSNKQVIRTAILKWTKMWRGLYKRYMRGQWGEMNQSLYAHMNNKRKMKKKKDIWVCDSILITVA